MKGIAYKMIPPSLPIPVDKVPQNSAVIVGEKGLEKTNKADSGENKFETRKIAVWSLGPGFTTVEHKTVPLNPVAEKKPESTGFVVDTELKKADDVDDSEYNSNIRKPGIYLYSPGWTEGEFKIQTLKAIAPTNPLVKKEPNFSDFVKIFSEKANDVGSDRKSLNSQGLSGKSVFEAFKAYSKENFNSNLAGPKGLKGTENQKLNIFEEYPPEEIGAQSLLNEEDSNMQRQKAYGSNWGTPDDCFKTRKPIQTMDLKGFCPIKQDPPFHNLKKSKVIFNNQLDGSIEQKLKARRLTNLEEDMNPQETHLIRLVTRTTPKKAKNTAKTITGSL